VVDIRRMSVQPETRGRGNILYPAPASPVRHGNSHSKTCAAITGRRPLGSLIPYPGDLGSALQRWHAIGFSRTVFSHGLWGGVGENRPPRGAPDMLTG
jgi:hypothetical protein